MVWMQSAAVSRPILSVMRLDEYGKEVTCREDGGTIRDRKTDRTACCLVSEEARRVRPEGVVVGDTRSERNPK